MKHVWRTAGLIAILTAGAFTLFWPRPNAASPLRQGSTAGAAVTPGISAPVLDLPIARVPEEILATELNPRQPPPVSEEATGALAAEEQTADALLEAAPANEGRTPASLLSIDGLASAGPIPPDTMGEVGPNHYVQMVNVRFAIYDKSGALVTGPHDFNSLFAGQGGQCERQNDGDPVVIYDRLADRWVLSQFARPSHMCFAVSQTADPTGAYFLYEFNVGSFPDYFKLGAWPDAYYMSANERTYTAYAFDRVRMLAGAAASFQKFTDQTNLLLPAHLTGATPPPAGTPGLFYTFKDETFHGGGPDRLELFEFHVDWATPANSTFSLAATLPLTAFNYTVCGFFNLACVTQPAPGERVDAVSEWPMWRFQYSNMGTHEALVGNFTVEVDGSEHAGIRWFELRRNGAGWTLHQEGTHAPDRNHRWMGSIGMDRDGNIALGYSVTGPDLNPAIRYATRLAGDPAGTLQAEATLHAGAGVQTGGFNRWGDYSSLSLDPADDCTFWYTNQYYQATSPGTWQTRFGSFRIDSCGQQPEEPGRLHEYVAKVVCGIQKEPQELRLTRGAYATLINLYNPNPSELSLRKSLVLAIPPGDQQPGERLAIADESLPPGQALAVDCQDIMRRVFGGSLPASYIDGFVVVESSLPLDVVAVYTTATLDDSGEPADQSSIDVERIKERTVSGVLPDLTVVDIDLNTFKVDCPSGAGSCVSQVEFTVANVGSAAAGPFRTLSVFDPAQSVNVDMLDATSLTPGGTRSYTATTTPGGNCFDPDCTICVTVDHTGMVPEADESNNQLCKTLPG